MKMVYGYASRGMFGIGWLATMLGLYFFVGVRDDVETWLSFFILGLSMIGGSSFFKRAADRLPETEYVTLPMEDVTEYIVERLPSWTYRDVLVTKEGHIWGMLRPKKMWSTPFLFFESFRSGHLFPVTTEWIAPNGKRGPYSVKRSTPTKCMLSVYAADGRLIGTYEEVYRRSLLKRNGSVTDETGRHLLTWNAYSAYGDVDCKRSDGTLLASYREGHFPYALREPFQASSLHPYLRLTEEATTDEKWLLLFIFQNITK